MIQGYIHRKPFNYVCVGRGRDFWIKVTTNMLLLEISGGNSTTSNPCIHESLDH